MSKNKKIIILISLAVFVILVIITINKSLTSKQSTTKPLLPLETSTGSKTKTYFPPTTDTSKLSQKVSDSTSQKEVDKIKDLLPIYIEKFSTSVNIDTTINVFQLKSDPKQVVHLEIYQVNYVLSEIKTENPNPTAFKESFVYIKNFLQEKGIDLNKMQIIYGDRNYIQTTSEYWIKALNLLP
jgi:hypothetical protein